MFIFIDIYIYMCVILLTIFIGLLMYSIIQHTSCTPHLSAVLGQAARLVATSMAHRAMREPASPLQSSGVDGISVSHCVNLVQFQRSAFHAETREDKKECLTAFQASRK